MASQITQKGKTIAGVNSKVGPEPVLVAELVEAAEVKEEVFVVLTPEPQPESPAEPTTAASPDTDLPVAQAQGEYEL